MPVLPVSPRRKRPLRTAAAVFPVAGCHRAGTTVVPGHGTAFGRDAEVKYTQAAIAAAAVAGSVLALGTDTAAFAAEEKLKAKKTTGFMRTQKSHLIKLDEPPLGTVRNPVDNSLAGLVTTAVQPFDPTPNPSSQASGGRMNQWKGVGNTGRQTAGTEQKGQTKNGATYESSKTEDRKNSKTGLLPLLGGLILGNDNN
jgi:hypothetical protein